MAIRLLADRKHFGPLGKRGAYLLFYQNTVWPEAHLASAAPPTKDLTCLKAIWDLGPIEKKLFISGRKAVQCVNKNFDECSGNADVNQKRSQQTQCARGSVPLHRLSHRLV